MTVTELIASLQRVEDQSLPVVWDDNEDGATVAGRVEVFTYQVADLAKYKAWDELGRKTPYSLSCYSERLVVRLVRGGELGMD